MQVSCEAKCWHANFVAILVDLACIYTVKCSFFVTGTLSFAVCVFLSCIEVGEVVLLFFLQYLKRTEKSYFAKITEAFGEMFCLFRICGKRASLSKKKV